MIGFVLPQSKELPETRTEAWENITREKNKKLGNFRYCGMGSNQVFPYTANKAITKDYFCFSSAQFNHSVVSDSLWPHASQHARPPCPSPTRGAHSNSCPSSRWCHPAISSSVVPFSCCPQSLPASESFPVSQLFAWGGQSTGVSASASVLRLIIVEVKR